jgi:hypothetical protein
MQTSVSPASRWGAAARPYARRRRRRPISSRALCPRRVDRHHTSGWQISTSVSQMDGDSSAARTRATIRPDSSKGGDARRRRAARGSAPRSPRGACLADVPRPSGKYRSAIRDDRSPPWRRLTRRRLKPRWRGQRRRPKVVAHRRGSSPISERVERRSSVRMKPDAHEGSACEPEGMEHVPPSSLAAADRFEGDEKPSSVGHLERVWKRVDSDAWMPQSSMSEPVRTQEVGR